MSCWISPKDFSHEHPHLRRSGRLLSGWGILAGLCLAASGLEAHQISAVGAEAKFFRDGTYRFALSLEVEASEDPALNDEISPEEAALEYLRAGIGFQFDDQEVSPAFSKPVPVNQAPVVEGMWPRVQLFTEAEGKIPPGSKAFFAKLSPETDVALVMLVEKDGIRERRARTLFAGETSRPVDLSFLSVPLQEGDPFDEEGKSEGPSWFVRGLGWIVEEQARSALILLAILLVSSSLQGVGYQSLAFLGAVMMGQLGSVLRGAPSSDTMAMVVTVLGLTAVATHNLRIRGQIGPIRYGLVAGIGALLGWCFPGQMRPEFLLGQFTAVGIGALVFWLVLGGFWTAAWYRAKLVRSLSWVLFGVAAYWLVEGIIA